MSGHDETQVDASFEGNLKAALMADKSLSRRGKKILAIINGPRNKRRERILNRMERHALAHMGAGADGIDWSTIDWAKVIEGLLKLLLMLLPLLL